MFSDKVRNNLISVIRKPIKVELITTGSITTFKQTDFQYDDSFCCGRQQNYEEPAQAQVEEVSLFINLIINLKHIIYR